MRAPTWRVPVQAVEKDPVKPAMGPAEAKELASPAMAQAVEKGPESPAAAQAAEKEPAKPTMGNSEEEQSLDGSLQDLHDRRVRRRTFRDITADPCFDHAPDYSSVTGELRFSAITKTWTVRYASVEEDDKYGGSVTLSEMGPMDHFKSGQHVHVEGIIADPNSHEVSPRYRVRTIGPVKEAAAGASQ
jgi:hypothetical protein